jgi:hypothetical protein
MKPLTKLISFSFILFLSSCEEGENRYLEILT